MSARLIIWDVQHGSAAYLRTPSGKHMVIDLGVGSMIKPKDATFSPLSYLRNHMGVETLDALFITHPHRDHLDDIGNLHLFAPRVVYAPRHLSEDIVRGGNKDSDKPIVDQYFKLVPPPGERPLFPVQPLLNPESGLVTGLGMLKVFVPYGYIGTNLNNHSLVLVIKYAGSTILFPGDNEAPSWTELLKKSDFVEAIKDTNILIAPHHGREAGYSTELMKLISPKLVIISDTDHGDTSVTNKYYNHAEGWNVWSRYKKAYEQRFCVTTRSDDFITLDMYRGDDGRNKLDVTID